MMVAFGGWMKMNDKVFNTEFEISMRLLLVLSLSNNNKLQLISGNSRFYFKLLKRIWIIK